MLALTDDDALARLLIAATRLAADADRVRLLRNFVRRSFTEEPKVMTAISEAERARRQSEPEQRRAAEANECASLRAELQALRIELTERRHAELTAIREALAEHINEAIDQVVMLNERLQTELWNLVKTQLGALQARVDGLLPETKSALRVARERADEVSESPNPLPPRRAIN